MPSAVGVSSDASSYSRTVSLGSQTQWSSACWLKIVTDRNAFSCALSLDAGSADAYVLMTAGDGTTMGVWDESASRASRALTAGTWYWFGIAINGANGIMTSRSASDSSFTTSTWSTGSSATVQTTWRIGRSPNTSEFLSGSLAAVKWWNTNLTQAELQAEFDTYVPQRGAGLRAWYPFHAGPDTTDWSGNGMTLSGGTGATEDTSGPPIAWDSTPRLATPYGGFF